MAKGIKSSPTGPRNVSDRKTSHPLSPRTRQRADRRSNFKDPAGYLTGKRDPDNIRHMCHGYRRSGPSHIVYRTSVLCNEKLHVDSTTNIFLEFPDEHIRNDKTLDLVSLTRPQWEELKTFLKHNLISSESDKKKLFRVIPRKNRKFVRTFLLREGVLDLWFDLETGKQTSRPTFIDPTETLSVPTPPMYWHPIWVCLQRVDSLLRLQRDGRFADIRVSPEQEELDSEMLEFFTARGLFDPMTLAEYREMVAQGWIDAEDEKNWLICRGKDREVPLYDPETGELVGPYRGSQGNWRLQVKPEDVSELGTLDPSSDDAPSSDPASDAELLDSQLHDLEEEFERELEFQDFTYESDDDEDKDEDEDEDEDGDDDEQPPHQLPQPKDHVAQTRSKSRTNASRRRSINATASNIPASAPAPPPDPALPPTTRRRSSIFHRPTRKPLPSPDSGSVDASSDDPPSSPTPPSGRVKKKARVAPESGVRAKSKASTTPATPPRRRGPTLYPTTPANIRPMTDSSPDLLDTLSHPVVPAPTHSITATTRAGPSTQVEYKMPVSKTFAFKLGRHTVVPRTVEDSDDSEPDGASGSDIEDEMEPGGGSLESRIRKRKRDDDDEDGDET